MTFKGIIERIVDRKLERTVGTFQGEIWQLKRELNALRTAVVTLARDAGLIAAYDYNLDTIIDAIVNRETNKRLLNIGSAPQREEKP